MIIGSMWVARLRSASLNRIRPIPITCTKRTGELCGSVFWVRFNQRFHLLAPSEEKYVAEIEKSIYNVGLANQVDSKGIRYLTHLEGTKRPCDGEQIPAARARERVCSAPSRSIFTRQRRMGSTSIFSTRPQ